MKFVGAMVGAINVVALMIASVAGAQSCPSACGLEMKACLKTARIAKLACKLDCRANAAAVDVGSCIRENCVDVFRSDKDLCRSDRPACVESCTPPVPPPAGCVDACGTALGGCARDVVTAAKSCVRDCRSASDRLGCLQECATTAQGGAEMCAADFSSCLEGCRPTTSTTLPPGVCGPDPTSGECGGLCPPGLSCLPPPPGSLIPVACLCRLPGSPSAAFVSPIR